MKPHLTALICCLALPACGDNAKSENGCDATADTDGDGLDDCTEYDLGFDPAAEDGDNDGIPDHEEAAMGLDPADADSDGDGFNDGEELDCGGDPTDPDTVCYACGWPKNNPGDLTPTGSDIGDVMDNISLVDQCGDWVDFHDFAGEYHIVYMTAAF